MPGPFIPAPAAPPRPPAFALYWEMTHDRSGEVVGSGFCRDQQLRLRPQTGYSYRVVELQAAPTGQESAPCLR